jgi:hypothetical protein
MVPVTKWRRLWCKLWSPTIGNPRPEETWHCPKCGRALPGWGSAGRNLSHWEMMTPQEMTAECLVDGNPLPQLLRRAMTEAEIRSTAVELAEQLEGDGESRWAKQVRHAALQGEELLPCWKLSHILYWLRRDRCFQPPIETIDLLLYAIGLPWPPTGRPPGPPRTTLLIIF